MAGEKGSYETFDSAGGPTIKDKGDYEHNDANPQDPGVNHGDVPEVPQKSK